MVAKVEAGRGVAIAGLVSSWRRAIVAQCDGRMSDVVVNGWVVGRRTAVAAQACGVQKRRGRWWCTASLPAQQQRRWGGIVETCVRLAIVSGQRAYSQRLGKIFLPLFCGHIVQLKRLTHLEVFIVLCQCLLGRHIVNCEAVWGISVTVPHQEG